ncbi:MAG: hypothetical protein JXQ66_07445, partial [Campylobacterales bacterium]|nr:hypothetical protein [Campylobacterales bacterium]
FKYQLPIACRIKELVMLDGFMYPASLIVLVLFAWMFYRDNSLILMSISLIVALYLVYLKEVENNGVKFQTQSFEKTKNYQTPQNKYSNDDF